MSDRRLWLAPELVRTAVPTALLLDGKACSAQPDAVKSITAAGITVR
jgi:hypothetical protein